MKQSNAPTPTPLPRRLLLGLIFLAAAWSAGAAWNWNRSVHAPDPRIIIHTESDALAGARNFLTTAQINTSNYDLSQASSIAKDRLKGQTVWIIAWQPKPNATVTNKLSVIIYERGCAYTDELTSPTEGVSIDGVLIPGEYANITRRHFMLNSPKGQ